MKCATCDPRPRELREESPEHVHCPACGQFDESSNGPVKSRDLTGNNAAGAERLRRDFESCLACYDVAREEYVTARAADTVGEGTRLAAVQLALA